MAFSLKSIFKTGVSKAATWAGTAIGGAVGGPTGAAIGGKIGSSLAGSLMSNSGAGGGDYEIQTQNPNSFAQNYGGRLGSERSDESGNIRMAKTVDGNDLNYMWERKLMNAMNKDAQYKKTLT